MHLHWRNFLTMQLLGGLDWLHVFIVALPEPFIFFLSQAIEFNRVNASDKKEHAVNL